MTTSIGAIAPKISCSGTPLQDQWLDRLIQVRINRAASLMGRATLRFTDAGFALSASDTFSLGTRIDITQPAGGALFSGTVTGVDLEQLTATAPELVVTADDAAYKLTRGTQVTTYLQSTYADALQTLAGRVGLQVRVTPSTLVMDYLLQAGSDLAFLNAVADRLGYAWYVDDDGTLVVAPLAPGSPVATLTLGQDMREFAVRATGLRPTAVSAHGWSPDQQNEVTDQNTAPAGANPPTFVSGYTGGAPASQLSAAATAVTEPRPLTADEARMLATARYDDWTSAAIVARGCAEVNSAIKPGVTIAVDHAGPASGHYLVTEVEHSYDTSGFLTRFVSGSRRPAGLVDTLGPDAPDPGFVMPGLVVGIVTDNNDPDTAGRVKVRYTGVNGQIESPWARVVGLGAGPSRGAVFSPEVNDEVLVGFEHGDTRRPVVIGGLFSKANTLPSGNPYVANGKVNYRRITSRTNNLVEFGDGDEPTAKHVMLLVPVSAEGGGPPPHKLRLGADRFDIALGEGKAATIQVGTAKFDISEAGDVTIEGNNITINAKAAVSIQANTTAALKGQAQSSLEGAQVQVKGEAMTTVQADGPVQVKGATVMIN